MEPSLELDSNAKLLIGMRYNLVENKVSVAAFVSKLIRFSSV